MVLIIAFAAGDGLPLCREIIPIVRRSMGCAMLSDTSEPPMGMASEGSTVTPTLAFNMANSVVVVENSNLGEPMWCCICNPCVRPVPKKLFVV